jgi:hypothetical protein
MNTSNRAQSFIWFVLCGSVFLAAYSYNLAPRSNSNKANTYSSCAVIEGNPSTQDVALAAALKLNIETSPFYTIPASIKGLASCNVRFYPDGEIGLEYHFREGSWLQVKRNVRIEYTEQNVRLNLKLQEEPKNILARAEQSAFGANGCGIDWHRSETQQADGDQSITETFFHGGICNCQARIRRNASGRVVGLMLRSAC